MPTTRSDSTADRRTKAELLHRIEELEKIVDNPPIPEAPLVVEVPEATALAACVRALDALKDSHRNSVSGARSNYTTFGIDLSPRRHTDIERVLRLLADRYDIPLVEVETRECTRPHVDELNPQAVKDSLLGSASVGPWR